MSAAAVLCDLERAACIRSARRSIVFTFVARGYVCYAGHCVKEVQKRWLIEDLPPQCSSNCDLRWTSGPHGARHPEEAAACVSTDAGRPRTKRQARRFPESTVQTYAELRVRFHARRGGIIVVALFRGTSAVGRRGEASSAAGVSVFVAFPGWRVREQVRSIRLASMTDERRHSLLTARLALCAVSRKARHRAKHPATNGKFGPPPQRSFPALVFSHHRSRRVRPRSGASWAPAAL
ncbi:hypothetical protein MRX96_007075 [Rhipicephalus microplus]